MRQTNFLKAAALCALFACNAIACNQPAASETATKTTATEPAVKTAADPAKLKSEIQEQETAWANADNARDVAALATFYSEDAVSMENNKPMLVGNAAIKQSMESWMTKRPKGHTTAYDVMDVFGDDALATETGKITRKDSTGKVVYTGKYMAIWEKRNGKWICIRDISNDDAVTK